MDHQVFLKTVRTIYISNIIKSKISKVNMDLLKIKMIFLSYIDSSIAHQFEIQFYLRYIHLIVLISFASLNTYLLRVYIGIFQFQRLFKQK